MVLCGTSEKPLVLLSLLREMKLGGVLANETDSENIKKSQALVFAASVESTHRLYVLLKLLGVQSIAEYSAQLTQGNQCQTFASTNLMAAQRTTILNDFRVGKIRTLICSDAMTRGMDLKDVEAVINYDVPSHVKTYVHRVGRTARAGKSGVSYTLLRSEDAYHFKLMMKKAEKEQNKPKDLKLNNDLIKPLKLDYQDALVKLKEVLLEEQKQANRETPKPVK